MLFCDLKVQEVQTQTVYFDYNDNLFVLKTPDWSPADNSELVMHSRAQRQDFNTFLCIFIGFLSTGNSSSKGNYGLHDQIAALKWIHANIANFGGDPERVSIFGSDSGAACVGFLMMSNLTKGRYGVSQLA